MPHHPPHPTRSDAAPFPRRTRQRWALAALGTVLFAVAYVGQRPLWEPDEGRYTAVAIEMQRLDDFLVPHLHFQQPHFTKPPLTYWAIAGSFAVLGRTEFAARLPGALAFAATALLVGGIAARLGRRRPLLATVVYATSLLSFTAANIVTTDTILALWETAAVWAFLSWWRPPGAVRGSRWWLTAMWACYGLAFLTKGPVGLLPLIPSLVAVGVWNGTGELRRMVTLLGMILFAVIGLSWYAAVVAARPELLDYFLRFEVVDRVVSDTHGRHGQWYGWIVVYGPVLVGCALPWAALLLGRGRRHELVGRLARWRRWRRTAPRSLFVALWLLIPLLVFVVARSRMPLYLVPSMAPISVAIAATLELRWRWTRTAVVATAAWCACLLGLRIASPAIDTERDGRRFANAISRGATLPVSEIVLVDEGNGYVLSFYLDAEVEHVWMASDGPPCDSCPNAQRLEEELAEHETHRIWLVPWYLHEQLEEKLVAASRSPALIGRWDKLAVYETGVEAGTPADVRRGSHAAADGPAALRSPSRPAPRSSSG